MQKKNGLKKTQIQNWRLDNFADRSKFPCMCHQLNDNCVTKHIHQCYDAAVVARDRHSHITHVEKLARIETKRTDDKTIANSQQNVLNRRAKKQNQKKYTKIHIKNRKT